MIGKWCGLLVFLVCGISTVRAERPNVVFLLVDDLGWGDFGCYPHYHRTKPYGAIRKSNWKLIEFFEDGNVELFDLKSDPWEKNDLAQREPERAAEMLKQLMDWRKSVDAQMPTPNPNYAPGAEKEKAKKQKN